MQPLIDRRGPHDPRGARRRHRRRSRCVRPRRTQPTKIHSLSGETLIARRSIVVTAQGTDPPSVRRNEEGGAFFVDVIFTHIVVRDSATTSVDRMLAGGRGGEGRSRIGMPYHHARRDVPECSPTGRHPARLTSRMEIQGALFFSLGPFALSSSGHAGTVDWYRRHPGGRCPPSTLARCGEHRTRAGSVPVVAWRMGKRSDEQKRARRAGDTGKDSCRVLYGLAVFVCDDGSTLTMDRLDH